MTSQYLCDDFDADDDPEAAGNIFIGILGSLKLESTKARSSTRCPLNVLLRHVAA